MFATIGGLHPACPRRQLGLKAFSFPQWRDPAAILTGEAARQATELDQAAAWISRGIEIGSRAHSGTRSTWPARHRTDRVRSART